MDYATFNEHPISQGGFSDVYYGRLLDNTQVAIKALRISVDEYSKHLKASQVFPRELHTWSKCTHPNVLPLYGMAEFRGRIGMVSPWMGQGNLPRYLERTPGVDRYSLCVQMCNGLSYMHQIGIIHGDLKGTNVLISDEGTPVLTDFGNSLHPNQSMKFTETTRNSSLTLRWSAPELLTGSGMHSKASDVYALGMTIYEVLAGTVPYNDKLEHTITYLVVINREHPSRPKSIPVGGGDGDKLWNLLLRCWSFEPEKRPDVGGVTATMKLVASGGLPPVTEFPVADSSTHGDIPRGLLTTQQAPGRFPSNAFLEGHECKILSQAPITGSTFYDVYEGLWLGGEKVVVKVLKSSKASEGNVRRFHRQVNIWHRLKSKYILQFYGVGTTEGASSFYLVSPWCENGDAPKYLKKNPNKDRLKLILEMAYGLRCLHSQIPPIAHGSLQGSSVLVGDDGGALLTDFGLSKALEDLNATPFTQSTGANGYYRWMAPELHEDGGQMTLNSDIYSWGMTALELYSDKVPYSRIRMPGSVVMEVAKGKIPERPRPGTNRTSSTGSATRDRDGIEIPDRLWEVLVRCWAKDSVNRPTIQEVIQELEDMRQYNPTPMEM
ncbi:hypothetical protein FRC11_005589 [Ceratobasidium sp. 423]|nr:hypothetical protein FRC11_005589 [Ceratobasidium sp. 423]